MNTGHAGNTSVRQTRSNASFDVLAVEAERRGIVVSPLGARNILLLSGFGRTARLFGTLTDRTSLLAVRLADDKRATKELLVRYKLPTPSFYAVDVEDEAVNALHALQSSVVLKPHNGNQGKGVSIDLITEDQVRGAFRKALSFSRVVLVERYHRGRDYRILVVNGRVIAVAEREPPKVVGDGIRSIAELLQQENIDPRRGMGDEKPMTYIEMDDHVEEFLSRSNRTPLTVPQQGEILVLRPIGSVSQGGSTMDRTGEIHPDLAALAVRATQLIGLDIAGIDIIADDISFPLEYAAAQIIEINSSPGLRAHLFPTVGEPRNPAVDIIDYLFPDSRISVAENLFLPLHSSPTPSTQQS